MPKWEYRMVPMFHSAEKRRWVCPAAGSRPELANAAVLTHYGDDGWELINVVAAEYVARNED